MTLAAAALLTARDYAIAANAELVARAAAEGWVCYMTMPEDEAYWANEATEYGIVTGADVIRRDAIQCYSDTYKDINGIRPNWVSFEGVSTDEIGVMLTALQAEAAEDISFEDIFDYGEPTEEEDMSLTAQEAAEDLYRILPSHLIQAWGE